MKLNKVGIIILLLALTLSSVSALIASMGNARMILRPEIMPGDEIELEQTIFVQNVNPVKVEIKVEPDENFLPYVEVLDSVFELEANESMDARFVIRIPEPGRYEGKILVSFFAASQSDVFNETPVGLASNIIIITKNVTKYTVKEELNTTPTNFTDDVIEQEKTKFSVIPIFVVMIVAIFIFVLGGKVWRKK